MDNLSVISSWDACEQLSTPECTVLAGTNSFCEMVIKARQPMGNIEVVSNARICELQRDGSYVSTTKATPSDHGKVKLQIDVQVSRALLELAH